MLEKQTDYKEELRRCLLERLDSCGDIRDEEILSIIDDIVITKSWEYSLSLKEKERLRKELFYSVRRLDVLQELIDDEEITEIMVNGYKDIFIEKNGRITKSDRRFTSEERLGDIIQQIVGQCNKTVNEQSPIVDARLSNGDRVNVVLPPVSLGGAILTIRRFPKDPVTIEQLVKWQSLTREAATFLQELVAAGYSILVGGGTSTGKTTFLNALSHFIPKDERIVTIEDNAELQIRGIENLVRLEAKDSNMEGNREITMRDLIKTALRMRPNRIIIGEVRGSEAWDFLTCLNTGHSGSLGSAHANSTKEMINRLEMMVRMGIDLPIPVIRSQIAGGVEILIHLERDAAGKRKVAEIAEIDGFDGENISMHTVFKRGNEGKLVKVGELERTEKMEKLKGKGE